MVEKNNRSLKFFGTYAIIQIANQFIGMLCGFILIRTMAKDQFSLLTIFNTTLASINILSDSGLGSAMFALAGPLTNRPTEFARVLAQMVNLRMKFLAVTCLVALPVMLFILLRTGGSALDIGLLLMMTVITAFAAAENVPLGATLRLRGDVRTIMNVEIVAGIVRLAIILLAVALGMNLYFATFATMFTSWLQLSFFRSRVTLPSAHEPLRADEQKKLWNIVLHSLPMVIFSTAQGQLAQYILCFFGTSDQIADIGAIGRFFVAFAILQQPILHFFIPAIARAQDLYQLRRMSLMTIGFAFGTSLATWITAVLGTPFCLWILGPQYEHLGVPFAFVMFSGAVGVLANTLWSVALSRGWVRYGWLQLPIAIMMMVAFAPFVNIDSLVSAILFGMVPTLASLIVAGATVWLHLYRQALQPDAGEEPVEATSVIDQIDQSVQ